MLARQALRCASRQTVAQSHRKYASQSQPPAPSSNSKMVTYAAATLAATVIGAIGYTSIKDRTEGKPAAAAEAALAGPTSKVFSGGNQGFLSLQLEKVENVNHNTKKFRFSLPDKNDISGLPVASALLLKHQAPGMDKPVLRPYTPTSDEDARGFLDLVVKKYTNGPMSTHMHDMQPGQRLDFKGPLPKYAYEANEHEHVALIAGGTGITPMYQVARAIFKNPEDKTKVVLVYGNLSEEDILLKPELEELENTFPQRFRAFYLVDKPSEKWQQGTGHIDRELLKTVLPFEPKDKNGKIFICGPPGMYKAISGAKVSPKDQGELSGVLKELGYSKDQVYKF